MRVLIAHPGLQHSHQLAWALEEAGHLAAFWSGVPVADSRKPNAGVWGLFGGRLRPVPVPEGKRAHAIIFPLLRRLLGFPLLGAMANEWNHRLDRTFDIWTARQVRKLRPDMVVCYENSALHTFKAAKRIGAVCVLDAASVHYLAARQWLADAGHANPAWIDSKKQEEIELADAIITCSEFAADTYRAAGCPADKLAAVPLGTALPDMQVGEREPGACRFVFVGTLRHLKGIDLLLDVFEALWRDGVAAELTLIGGIAEDALAERARALPNVSQHAFMPQSELFAEVARHDCLILPSRFDSFGMVVPEAMAVGVPAIVSDRVGAKCIIDQHPDSGWIVPCEEEALKAKVLQLTQKPELLVPASRAARVAAQDYSWENYRRRIVETLESMYALHGKPLQ